MTSQCGPRRPNLNESKVRRRYDVACRVGSFPLIFTSKICIMTVILTGQRSICCHTLLGAVIIRDFFNKKILNMVLFLKKKLHIFGIKTSPLRSCCGLYNELCETSFHIFHECDRVKCLRSNLVQCFQNNLILPTFTPQTAIF